MTSQLSAAALAMVAGDDPQFRLPVRPAIVPGIVLEWVPDGLLVEGTGNRRVLGGSSARQILPRLLPLLDGTRTLTDLSEEAAQSARRVHATLLLLLSCGVLQEGCAIPTGLPAATVTLLARFLDTTRVNANVTEAAARLTAARVTISAPIAVAGLLAAELADLGVGSLDVGQHDVGQHDVGQPDVGQHDVGQPDPNGAAAVGVGADGEPDLAVVWVDRVTDAVRDRCRALRAGGAAVLLTGPADHGLLLGPYSAPDFGACPDCALDDRPRCTAELDDVELSVAAAQIAIEVLCLVSRVGTPMSLRGRQRIALDGGPATVDVVAPRPGCPTCGEPAVSAGPAPLAYAYECSVAFPPRRLVNPRDHQHHFESANVALQYELPDFAGRDGIPLPGADLATPDPSSETPAADRLGALLAGICGFKPDQGDTRGKVLRWAPTGGNLGSAIGYVELAGVHGLPDGRYGYDPRAHALVPVGPTSGDPSSAHGLGPEPVRSESGDGITLVLAGALVRVARKYRTFAYRVVHLDAGVALAHLALLAGRVGVRASRYPAWDDRVIAERFGIDPMSETITAVARLELLDPVGGDR